MDSAAIIFLTLTLITLAIPRTRHTDVPIYSVALAFITTLAAIAIH